MLLKIVQQLRPRLFSSDTAARLAELRRDARDKDGPLVHGLLLSKHSYLVLAQVDAFGAKAVLRFSAARRLFLRMKSLMTHRVRCPKKPRNVVESLSWRK